MNNQFEWQEGLPVEAQQNREVFARFGLAMYRAQCLERGLGLMLSVYKQEFFLVPPEKRDSIFDEEFGKTLGKMVNDIGKKVSLSPTLETRLRQAVKLRNSLAHDYFWEHAVDILNSEGREKMITELQEHEEFFGELDKEFSNICDEFLHSNGVSKEKIESIAEKLRCGEYLDQ